MKQYNQQTIQTILEQTKYTFTSRGFMFEHQDVTYYVERTNLSKEEDIKLIKDILYSKQALIDASADKYQTQFGKLPDQDAALKISIFINENDKEVKHIFCEYNGGKESLDDSFLNPNLIAKAEILADEASIKEDSAVDGSDHSEEPAAVAAEHNAPDQHQVAEAEGGDNTNAPSFFSSIFSTIGDFFSSIFSSIFSFIFGPDSEEKEEAQQPPQVSELINSNSAEEEEKEGGAPNPESDVLESEVIEKEGGSPNPESDAPESEAGEEQIIVGDHSQEPDDSTFSISSIFSTLGSYLGLSKIGSYLGLSKMGSYLSSIFSSDEGEDSQQLQNGENLPSHASHLDIPADLDVPTNTDSSSM